MLNGKQTRFVVKLPSGGTLDSYATRAKATAVARKLIKLQVFVRIEKQVRETIRAR